MEDQYLLSRNPKNWSWRCSVSLKTRFLTIYMIQMRLCAEEQRSTYAYWNKSKTNACYQQTGNSVTIRISNHQLNDLFKSKVTIYNNSMFPLPQLLNPVLEIKSRIFEIACNFFYFPFFPSIPSSLSPKHVSLGTGWLWSWIFFCSNSNCRLAFLSGQNFIRKVI